MFLIFFDIYRNLVGVIEGSLKAPGEEVVRRNLNGDELQWKGNYWAQYVGAPFGLLTLH